MINTTIKLTQVSSLVTCAAMRVLSNSPHNVVTAPVMRIAARATRAVVLCQTRVPLMRMVSKVRKWNASRFGLRGGVISCNL